MHVGTPIEGGAYFEWLHSLMLETHSLELQEEQK